MKSLTASERLALLNHAITIAEGETAEKVYYVDIGNLPKQKAEDYIAALVEKHPSEISAVGATMKHHWMPRREGGRGTEIVTLPGVARLSAVLEIAQKLAGFCEDRS